MNALAGSVVVDTAIRAGIAGLALAAALVVTAVMARMLLVRRQRRADALHQTWAPLMLRSLRGELADVPSLAPGHREAVVALWVRMCETITGEGQGRLTAFAFHAGIADAVLSLLSDRRPVVRVTGAAAAGRLQLVKAVPALESMTASPHLVERAQAGRALIRIDPAVGLARVVPLLAEWQDCHPATAATLLDAAPVDLAAPVVAAAAFDARDPAARARLVRILSGLHHPAAVEGARRLLAARPDPEVAAACLQIVGAHREPTDAELVRGYLDHPEGFVRVHAVSALGRLRIPGEEWRLVRLLGDSDWWVRYRAAQALTTMPRVGRPLLETLSRILPDPYARDALRQALSEPIRTAVGA